MNIRPATPADDDAIWAILEPTTRAGDTFALPPESSKKDYLAKTVTADSVVVEYTDSAGAQKTVTINKGGLP